jgi:hypothetical protein
MGRSRYDGSVEDLHAAIRPYVTSTGWFQYHEKVSEHIRSDILVANKQLLRTLTELSPNLSFNKSQLEQVLNRLLDEKAFPELTDQSSRDHWVDVYCKRLQVACRHTSQSRLRKPPPKWLSLIDEDGADSMSQMPGLPESHEDSAEQVGTGSPVHPAGGEDAQLPMTQDPMA